MGPKMPVSLVCESQTDISSAIRNSLSNGVHNGLISSTQSEKNIQNQFVASAKRALLSKIEYEEVSNINNSVHDTLKSKYIVLKPPTSTSAATVTSVNSNNNGKSMVNGCGMEKHNGSVTEKKSAELPTPKHILYSREKVQIGWKSTDRKWHVGAGMMNVGNTCYLNSTLQAIFHVPAFANWLVSDSQHRETCEEKIGIQGGCIICAVAKTLIASQQNSQAIKPYLVYSKLRSVCKHLVPGQQEDAHEFLRYLMEAMEKAYLSRFSQSSQFGQYSKETTPINQILGGYLRTSVRCLTCGHVSVTFQHFEDLLLDIRKANTLEEALDLYFARERLEDMGYKCESCKKKVSATKQFSLERAPISLCIQLKRFSIVGNKLNKHIAIRQQLNLSKYSSRKSSNDQLIYRLVSMVTHLGSSQHCGHYTAIGLTDAGGYYQFDDSCVRSISVQNVLNTNSYIMFYELEPSSNIPQCSSVDGVKFNNTIKDERSRSIFDSTETLRNHVTTTVTSGSTSKAFIGPVLPISKLNGNSTESNAILSTTLMNSTNVPSAGSSNMNGRLLTNGINKSNLGSKLVTPYKKNEISPITIKLTNNGCRYINNSNASLSTTKSANDLNQIPYKNSEHNANIFSNEKDKDDTAVSTNNNNKNNNNNDKESILPSMPKLDATPANLVCNEKTLNNTNGSIKKNNSINLPNVETPSTSDNANGRVKPEIKDCDSDSSIDSHSSGTKQKFVNKLPSIASCAGLVISNGNVSKQQFRPQKLVPYTSDDDSEYESGTESPPVVKTKAGTFQVTPNTLIPRVISNFIRNSNDKSPTKPVPNAIGVTQSASKIPWGRRESDGSGTSVKTAASLAQNSNANKRPSEWHGNETANKLLKYGHRGYGASVTTWNGQKSNMEKEVNDEKKDELKRQMLDANDAEIDRGHKKKANHTKSSAERVNPGYNPFQEHQNQRNSWTVSNGNGNNNTNNNGNNNIASAGRSLKNHVYRQSPHGNRFHHNNNNNKTYRNTNGGRHFGNPYNHNHFQRRQTNK